MNQHTLRLTPRTLIFIFAVVVFVFLAGRSLAQSESSNAAGEVAGIIAQDVQRTVDRIARLSIKSEKRGAACEAYFDRVRAATADSERKEFFASKASALAALDLAGRYPGTPAATSGALEAFLELYELPRGAGLSELELALARLSDCRAVEFYGVLTRLIDPRTRKLLTDPQIAAERRLVLSYLNHETSSGPKFFHQVDKMVDLFAASVDEGLLSPAKESRIAIDSLKWRAAKIRTENNETLAELEESRSQLGKAADPAKEEKAVSALEDYSAELAQSEELQEDLRQVVEFELGNLSVPPGLRIARKIARAEP